MNKKTLKVITVAAVALAAAAVAVWLIASSAKEDKAPVATTSSESTGLREETQMQTVVDASATLAEGDDFAVTIGIGEGSDSDGWVDAD